MMRLIFLKKIKVTIYDSVPISAKFGDNITEIVKTWNGMMAKRFVIC